jgi:minor extracellular serine protease Vpr
MNHRVVASFVALIALLAMGLPAAAGDGPTPYDSSDLEVDRQSVSLDQAGITDLRDEIHLFLHLTEPAVTEFVAEEKARGRGEPPAQARGAHAQRVERQHDRVIQQLARMGIEADSALKTAVNGIRVRTAVERIPELSRIAGVEQVVPVTLHEPANDTSVPWINAPEAWAHIDGTGEGIIIAVIDTGVDYTHASFEGSGDPADYDFIAEDTTVIPEVDGDPVFPTAKVIDGHDFVGVDYDAGGDPDQQIPQPNPNPIDVHGHGTHVAGSAAGVEVSDGEDVLVGSGVAPGAYIYALKVFGDIAGSTAVTADAIEWAIDPQGDGSMEGQAHVINMSLGAPFGDPNDPSAVASQNATEVGTVVVASAGNSGQDAAYVTGSPAVAPGAISVAASIDGGLEVLGLEVNSPEGVAGIYEAAESATGAPLAEVGPITQDLAVADPILACADLTNPDEVAGKIAFVQRGVCPFTVKHQVVQDAGAVGIVVFNNVPGDPFVMGGDPTGIHIPGLMISLSDGQTLMAAIDDGETVNVTMSDDIVIPKPELADTLAGFTSRGPGGETTFKPDVSAPGFAIRSARVGAGTGSSVSSGTSMAAPHVAGLAALLAEQHGLNDLLPPLDPEEQDESDRHEAGELVQTIKSLIMNSTVPASDDFQDYPIALQGTGVVRADRAVMTDAFTTPAGLSFGRHNPLVATSVTEEVTVTNLGDTGRTFGISFTAWQEVEGVSFEHPASVTVDAGDSETIEVTLSLDPSEMPPDLATFSQTEFAGWLTLVDGDLDLHAGVLAVVDPAAAVEVSAESAPRGPGGSLVAANPSHSIGTAFGFTLVGEGDDVGGVTEALGVRTDTLTIGPEDDPFDVDVVQFGVATDAWESLSSRETQILIDTGGPGFEYAVVAADLGLLLGANPSGTVATALFDLEAGTGFLQWFVNGDYHNQVQMLTVDRRLPTGFLDGRQRFDYLAVTFERGALIGLQEGRIDLRQQADGLLNPLIGFPAGFDGAFAEYPRQDRRDMLWLYPQNQVGDQFDIVRLR